MNPMSCQPFSRTRLKHPGGGRPSHPRHGVASEGLLDLRQFASWCQQHQLALSQARRPDIECFTRDLEARGRARDTTTRRLPLLLRL